jgi:hypothetical protein
MRLLTECAAPECLDALTGLIHDCTFSVDDVVFDKARGSVRVPFKRAGGVVASWFSFLKRGRAPGFLLEIGLAESVLCEDTQGIGSYGINRLEYHRDSGVLKICTTVPTAFDVHVGALDIKVYDIGD